MSGSRSTNEPLKPLGSLESLRQEMEYEKTNACVQCGYCLPVCPTYATMGKETHSPRGRINLVKMVGEGRITDLTVLEEPLDLCLGCRACETACPTGVEYGSILEASRAAIVRRKTFPLRARVVRHVMLKRVFPSRRAMKLIGHGMWWFERSGLRAWTRRTGIARKLPAHLGEFEAAIPPAVPPSVRSSGLPRLTQTTEAPAKYKVAFFAGCVMDAVFHDINRLSVSLLAACGCDVVVVENQTCCGALHAHAGEADQAKALAKRNIAAFEAEEADFIVNNAGGCGAMLHEYDRLLADDPEWAERARRFSARSKDISQIITRCGGLPYADRPPERVSYQPSCHMTNVQKVTEEPLQLIRSVPNVDFVEMKDAAMCCGSAGIYNLIHYEASMDILDAKMAHVRDTAATTVIATNPGCLLQMKLGIERAGLQDRMRAVHLAEWLAEAAGIEPLRHPERRNIRKE